MMRKRAYSIGMTILCVVLLAALVWSRRSQPAFEASDVKHQGLLQRRIQAVHFRDVLLDAAITELGKQAGVPISINWLDAARSGVERSQSVSFDATDLSLEAALTWAFNSDHEAPHRFYGRELGDTLVVSFTPTLVARMYDVSDIFIGELFMEANGGWTPRDGTRSRLPFSSDPGPSSALMRERYTIAEFTSWIERWVDPNSWRDQGGQSGEIRFWHGRVLIVQTEENQSEVLRFLQKFRQGPERVDPATGSSPEETDGPVLAEYRRLRARPAAPMHFERTPLAEAIRALAAQTGAPIILTSEAQVAAMIPITLDTGPATLGETLDAILRAAMIEASRTAPDAYREGFGVGVEHGLLRVGTEEQFETPTYLRIYDVRDLALAQKEASRAMATLPHTLRQLGEESLQDATEIVGNLVYEKSYSLGSVEAMHRGIPREMISSWAGRLVVNQPPEGHAAIRHVLAELRAAATQPATQPITRPLGPGPTPP